MSNTYTAESRTITARPRSKRLRETGKVSTSSLDGAQVAGETYWQKSTDEDGNDIIKASMGAQVTKTVYLVTEDGTKVATMSIDENGRFYFDKGIISAEDVVSYGVEDDDIATVEELIEDRIEANPTETATAALTKLKIGSVVYLVEGGGGGGGSFVWGGVTGSGNAITAINYDSQTGTLSAVKGSTFLTQHQDISGKADKTQLSSYLPLAGGTMTGILKLQDLSYNPNNTKTQMNGGAQSDSAVIGVRTDGAYYRPHILSGDGNIVFGHARYDSNKWGFLGVDTNGVLSLKSCKNDAKGIVISTSGDVTANGSFGASTDTTNDRFYSAENANGKIALLTSTNRGVYDTTKGAWLIATNGTNTFLNDGNVGIGTAAPVGKLHVIQAAWDNGLVLQRTAAHSGCGIRVLNSAGSELGIFGVNGSRLFEVNLTNDSGTSANRMVIDGSTGNVGVGTITPQLPLHIKGAARINSYIDFLNTAENARSGWLGRGSSANNQITVFADLADLYLASEKGDVNIRSVTATQAVNISVGSKVVEKVNNNGITIDGGITLKSPDGTKSITLSLGNDGVLRVNGAVASNTEFVVTNF